MRNKRKTDGRIRKVSFANSEKMENSEALNKSDARSLNRGKKDLRFRGSSWICQLALRLEFYVFSYCSRESGGAPRSEGCRLRSVNALPLNCTCDKAFLNLTAQEQVEDQGWEGGDTQSSADRTPVCGVGSRKGFNTNGKGSVL